MNIKDVTVKYFTLKQTLKLEMFLYSKWMLFYSKWKNQLILDIYSLLGVCVMS